MSNAKHDELISRIQDEMLDSRCNYHLLNKAITEIRQAKEREYELCLIISGLVGSDDNEFAGAGAAGLSHLREMYRNKWDALGPSCRMSLKNCIDNYLGRKAKEARQSISQ